MSGPFLLIRDAVGSERTVELRDGVMRIGRGAGNDIVIGDASQGVSRNHAELHVENGRCTIVDLHSQNGTWVNALRVQRAEVRPEAEIAIGLFRMRVQMTSTVSTAGRMPSPPARGVAAGSAVGAEATAAADMRPTSELPLHAQLATSPVPIPAIPHPTAQSAKAPRSRLPLIYGGIGAVAMIALAIALFSIPSKKPGDAPALPPAVSPGGTPSAPPSTPAAPPASQPAVPPPAPEAPVTAAPATPPAAAARAPAPPAKGSATPAASARTSGKASDALRTTAADLPVPRRPGESLQDWRARGAALQTRYAFAKVALDRGDFSAAAGGFAAILLEEPGFLDAPQLLNKAREGLRAAAAEAIESGNKLDAAGDWVNALRRYDQAREIDRATPGLEDAIKRVREKMHVAGLNAFKRARQFDTQGQLADALTDYEKAAQWLSPDDPNQQIARARADQLRARLR